jgi:single-stranded-DNA-specific exonuclease
MPVPKLEPRDAPPRTVFALEQAGFPTILARLWAARGVRQADELADDLQHLLPPDTMLGAAAAGARFADAIARQERICIVADYDCDGATACAVAVRGLRLLGARPQDVSYIIPDRRLHGYGLTPTIVDLAMAGTPEQRPHLLVTVDNGIASFDGVAHAIALGLHIVVTDHHLPALLNDVVALPDATVIVNPNQPGCGFASKNIAGVGVMFYSLLAARAVMRERGLWTKALQPRLDTLLDLVALGTVADVVKLDANNRRLVAQGLKRMRARRMQPGLAALFSVAARDPARAAAFDLGFAIGPRLNAAGRLADMSLGVACLLSDDPTQAAELAMQLDHINRQRRDVESDMHAQAAQLLAKLPQANGSDTGTGLNSGTPNAVTLFDESFHEGVVGIVAGRVKDAMHRPTFVFARTADGALKGSGRSIPGFHLRDALDLMSKRHPGLLLRFGGHAMAAGCTLGGQGFTADGQAATSVAGSAKLLATFDEALRTVADAWLDEATRTRRLRTDGSLAKADFDTRTVALLDAQVWGQAFEAPVFCDEVEVLGQRIVGDKHLKLRVRHHGEIRDAIWFGHIDSVATDTQARVRMAYRVALDEYQGRERVQMIVEAIEALQPATITS